MDADVDERETKQRILVVGLHSTSYNLFMLAVILFSLIITLLAFIRPVWNAVLWRVDFLICGILFVGFLNDLWRAPDKLDYFFRQGGWLDLLGTVPSVIGLPWTMMIRLSRLNQAVRIVRHLRGKDASEVFEETRQSPAKTILFTTVVSAIVLITVTSLLVLSFERGAADASIRNGNDALWWAIVTISTVGYGDYVPVTFPSRVLAILLMTFGTGIVAVLTSYVASRVMVTQQQTDFDQEAIIETIQEENAALRKEMVELRKLLMVQSEKDDDHPRD